MGYSNRPIIHMHISKTAGTYIDSVFATTIGSDNSVIHFECLETFDIEQANQCGKVYFSAHITLPDLIDLMGNNRDKYFIITSLRDPLGQVASHIGWLDHYNEPDYISEFEGLPAIIKEEVMRIKAIDFESADSLLHYLENLSETGIRLFDNCQVRYLCKHSGLEHASQITESDLNSALNAKNWVDYVLYQGRIDEDIENLGTLLGMPLLKDRPKNISPASRKLDLSRPDICDALKTRVTLDQVLVERLCKMA